MGDEHQDAVFLLRRSVYNRQIAFGVGSYRDAAIGINALTGLGAGSRAAGDAETPVVDGSHKRKSAGVEVVREIERGCRGIEHGEKRRVCLLGWRGGDRRDLRIVGGIGFAGDGGAPDDVKVAS